MDSLTIIVIATYEANFQLNESIKKKSIIDSETFEFYGFSCRKILGAYFIDETTLKSSKTFVVLDMELLDTKRHYL